MNLGETIYRLRTERNMSQGDLAEALEVSRQSISKWETGGSVPELDKLTKMGELFGVSMDELILGKKEEKEAPPAAPAAPAVAPARSEGPNRKTVGLVLFCLAAAVWIVCTLLGGFLEGLIFASPFILCGLVCVIFKKNVGLWCAWVLFFVVNMYLRYATGITWRLTLWTFRYEQWMNYVRLIFAWVEVAGFVALIAVTVCRFGRVVLSVSNKAYWWLAVRWVAFAATMVPVAIDPENHGRGISYYLFDWLRVLLLTVSLIYTVRLIRGWKQKK